MDPSYHGRVPQVPYSRRGGRFQLNPRMLVLGGILLACIIAGFLLLSNTGDKSGPLQQHLTARLATLDKIIDEGEKNISDGDLRAFNARLSLQVTGDTTSIDSVLTQKKTDPKIIANEADTASFDALNDAQLNSRFDSTYRTLVAQKLDSTTALMQELYAKTTSKKLKDALASSYGNLQKLESEITPTTTTQQ